MPAPFLVSGERQKKCVLHIRDDSVKEGPEELRLVLGSQRSSTAGVAMLGEPSVANIRIRDESDREFICRIPGFFVRDHTAQTAGLNACVGQQKTWLI